MLTLSLSYIVLHTSDSEQLNNHMLDAIIKKHNDELRIPKALYSVWRKALIDSLEIYDPEFTPELGEVWQRAIDDFIVPFGATDKHSCAR